MRWQLYFPWIGDPKKKDEKKKLRDWGKGGNCLSFVLMSKFIWKADGAHYWNRLYPWEAVLAFLEGPYGMASREVGIQWKNDSDGSTAMQRNVAYETPEEFKTGICRRGARGSTACRLEFGCFHPGVERQATRSNPARPKELCFDIDITDYDKHALAYGPAVFPCGSRHAASSGVCDECWRMVLAPGARVLALLMEHMAGLEQVLWVFSGRKGYHAIAVDEQCYRWSNATRHTIAQNMMNPQDPALLTLIYDRTLYPLLFELYSGANKPPVEVLRLNLADMEVHLSEEEVAAHDMPELMALIKRRLHGAERWTRYIRGVLRALFWPRVDLGPLEASHLLKVPFCVHEGTGNVCVALKPDLFAFKPSEAPKALELMMQHADGGVAALAPYVENMRRVAFPRTPPTEWRVTAHPWRPSAEVPRRKRPVKHADICNVDWRKRSAEEYADAMIRVVKRQREVAGFKRPLIVVPDHEWYARVRILTDGLAECAPQVVVATEEGDQWERVDGVVLTHMDEGATNAFFVNHLQTLVSDDAPLIGFGSAGGGGDAVCTLDSPEQLEEFSARAAVAFKLERKRRWMQTDLAY